MVLTNGATTVNDLCGKCKNAEFCKYVITDQEALSGLRNGMIGDCNGPFAISITCKYRTVETYSNTRALTNSNLADNYGGV